MGVRNSASPVIIKRKKIVKGEGHHGGAWKVAYADFVTAMMAFFMLMWLLNATTEKQRKGLADYFSPSIPINRISGGGDGAFGGNNAFSQDDLPRDGTGASNERPADALRARGVSGVDRQGREDSAADQFREVEAELFGLSGESLVADETLEHIVTKVTDEGLVIEVFARPGAPLFEGMTDTPRPVLRDVARLIARVSSRVSNEVAVEGHVPAAPVIQVDNPVWDRSAARADRMRRLLEAGGLDGGRVARVTGHADRELSDPDPMSVRNNRLEVILLRDTP
jgi:chemotaxis protein MotB